MKNLSLLGSTGSIGTQTLEIVKQYPKEFMIVGLTTNKKTDVLLEQIQAFKPSAVAVFDKDAAEQLMLETKVPVYSGLEGLNKIARLQEADTVINGLVGSIGVLPTIEAINAKKNIALANKETLVTAGSVVMDLVAKNKVTLMPIDSEHSAIFQCLNGENKKEVKKITITCSGGPFRNHTSEQLKEVTMQDALQHPTWNMGGKITIDSATLMNKGFEIIETHYLYGLDYSAIDFVIHPQSIVHALVEFNDHSVVAQLGHPDMKIPIQYALTYPQRFGSSAKRLDLAQLKSLTFDEPDMEKFPCPLYAYEAGKKGGTLPAVLNAANEVAVHAFLDGKIKFLQIASVIRKCMDAHSFVSDPDIEEILAVDTWAREEAGKIIEQS